MPFLRNKYGYIEAGLKRLNEITDLEGVIEEGYLMAMACPDASRRQTHILVIPCPEGTSINSLADKICEEAKICHPGLEESYFRVAPAEMPFLPADEFANSERYPDAPYKASVEHHRGEKGDMTVTRTAGVGIGSLKLNINGATFTPEELAKLTSTLRALQGLSTGPSGASMEPILSELEKH